MAQLCLILALLAAAGATALGFHWRKLIRRERRGILPRPGRKQLTLLATLLLAALALLFLLLALTDLTVNRWGKLDTVTESFAPPPLFRPR
ncbi:MAG: hypothetical protein WC789_00250 [Lentisphaeria bacterium]|jgi:hypothetical protein